MYGAIPDVVISKPRQNEYRVVVALAVGVLIGALGTASMLFPVATKLTPAPTPAPRAGPILAAMELDAQSHGCSADAIKYFQDHAVNVAFSVCSERCGQNPCLSLFPN